MNTYSINLCTRHPDVEDFDHISTGEEFADLASARAVFDAPDPVRALAEVAGVEDVERYVSFFGDSAYVWLDGVENADGSCVVRQLRPERRETTDDWRREQAMQAGMAFGCDGYNDAMGY